MQIITNLAQLRLERQRFSEEGASVALVPTMGALHQGHASLVKIARLQARRTIVSIFVNSLQFNDPKDLERYPRTLEADLKLLEQLGVSLVFAPENQAEFYPEGFQTYVTPGELAQNYEGKFRPGHFRGVATVVCLLFNLIQPDFAIFGEKDFQQLRIIEQLVKDLKIPTEIIRAPIVREQDGLALSSRNVLLSSEARQAALAINRGLRIAHDAYRAGERRAGFLRNLVLDMLASEVLLQVDYVDLVDEVTLTQCQQITQPARLLVAAYAGAVRLIDNVGL